MASSPEIPFPLLRGGRFDARHRAGVHVLAVAEGVVAMGALDLEPELLVERDADRVCRYERTA